MPAGSGGWKVWRREKKQVILVGNWNLLLLGHDGKEEAFLHIRLSYPHLKGPQLAGMLLRLNSFPLYLFSNQCRGCFHSWRKPEGFQQVLPVRTWQLTKD